MNQSVVGRRGKLHLDIIASMTLHHHLCWHGRGPNRPLQSLLTAAPATTGNYHERIGGSAATHWLKKQNSTHTILKQAWTILRVGRTCNPHPLPLMGTYYYPPTPATTPFIPSTLAAGAKPIPLKNTIPFRVRKFYWKQLRDRNLS